MGAGRETETHQFHTKNVPLITAANCSNISPGHRLLSKANLGGVVFGCTKNTMQECLSKQLFGLPPGHTSYVRNIEPGLPLFLFNYSDRKLHGIFEAASPGQLNINPYGWTNGSEKTHYPAQVQVRLRLHCQPLSEDQFKRIILDNYCTDRHFQFELDHAQANRLISLFASLAIASGSSIPQQHVRRRNISAVFPSVESREGPGEILVMPTSAEQFNESSGKSDSTDGFPVSEGDNQSAESYEQMIGEVDNKEDLLIAKLKSCSLNQEFQDLGSENDSRYIPAVDDVPSTEKDPLEALAGSTKEDNEETLDSSFDYPAVIDKLIQEIEELKAYKTEQARKLSYLEEKLAKTETEFRGLKDYCSKLESVIDPSSQSAWESTEEPFNEQHLNLGEPIFLIGGYDTSSHLSTLDSYFPSQDVIKSLKPMNFIRSYASVVKLNEELYVFGGGNGDLWYNTVDCYSLADNTWTLKPSLNSIKGSLAAAALHDKIFALGGGDGKRCFLEVEMLDLDIGRWIPSRSMTHQRFAHAAVELNGVIYATGGFDGKYYLNSAERFDPREYSWTKMPSMNSRRGCHSLVVLNEKLYALGGFDETTMVPSVEIFDPRMGSWIMGESMNSARGYSGAAVLDGSIYVIGGVKVDRGIADTVEHYKEGQGWRETVSTAIGRRGFLSAIVP